MVPTLYVQVQYMHRLITLVVRSGSRLTGGGCYLVIAAVLVAIAGQGQVSTLKRNLNQRGRNSYSDFRRCFFIGFAHGNCLKFTAVIKTICLTIYPIIFFCKVLLIVAFFTFLAMLQ